MQYDKTTLSAYNELDGKFYAVSAYSEELKYRIHDIKLPARHGEILFTFDGVVYKVSR